MVNFWIRVPREQKEEGRALKVFPEAGDVGGYTHPPATMQKAESKGVTRRASWKFLKIKGQICNVGCKICKFCSHGRASDGHTVSGVVKEARLASIRGLTAGNLADETKSLYHSNLSI